MAVTGYFSGLRSTTDKHSSANRPYLVQSPPVFTISLFLLTGSGSSSQRTGRNRRWTYSILRAETLFAPGCSSRVRDSRRRNGRRKQPNFFCSRLSAAKATEDYPAEGQFPVASSQ